MDLKTRYQALVDFLLPYQDIWRNEIMLQYPRPMDAYPAAWITEMRRHTAPSEIWKLLQGQGWDKLENPELVHFHQQLQHLSTFPKADGSRFPAKPISWVHIIPKKQHEIEALAPLIDQLMQQHDLKRVVDIGGGQGHLAQSVAHHYGREVLSLDMDPELQKTGRYWQQIKWKESSHQVEFRPHKIERNDQNFAALMDNKTLTTGLHTCGALAVAHIEAALLAGSAVMNMGCCFHKMVDGEWHLSSLPGIPLNQFALTLASGAHLKVTEKDVAFRQQVRRQRYPLHFLLHHEFGMYENVTLGNSTEAIYNGGFADYVREQLSRIGMKTDLSDAALKDFQQNSERLELVEDMIAVGTIRDVLGRPLEAWIHTDRALWMEEQNYKVKIEEVFDPQQSPRNLLITAVPQ